MFIVREGRYIKAPLCKFCGGGHYVTFCRQKPRKPIKKRSDKQIAYEVWLEETARPFIINRDGNFCVCCKRAAYEYEKLDIEHEKTKGSRPDLKREIRQLRLMCRFPCHRNRTDRIPCTH